MPDMNVNPIDEDAILKEVWNTAEIDAKTDLNVSQIENINKLKTLAKLFNNSLLESHLNEYMVLLKSKDRKSMGEFVGVVKARREDFVDKGKGFFGSMFG